MINIELPNKFTARNYQQEHMDWFDGGGRFRIDVWHRRAGKDLTSLHQTCKMMMQRKGMYWHCLPSFAQARKAVWNAFDNTTGERLLRAVFPKAIVKHPDEFRPQAEMLIETTNGSMLQLIGSDNINAIVGAGPLHVTFSEYSLCRPNSFDLVRPMLRQNAGSAAFITTPRGKNHAYKLFQTAGTAKGWSRSLYNVYHTNLRYHSDADPNEMISPDEMMEEERRAGMQPELVRQEYLCDWTAALVGTIWGDLLEALEKSQRVCALEPERVAYTNWDLGFNDSTGIWFWSLRGNEGIDIFDHYENHGKGLNHYFDVLEQKAKEHNVTFQRHYLPHDAAAKNLCTLTTIQEQFYERFMGKAIVEIVPKMAVLDGIQAARWLLQQDIRFHPRTEIGFEALKQYHYEYDDKRRTYTSRPEHDWASHSADAFRYLATVVRVQQMIRRNMRKDEPEPMVRLVNGRIVTTTPYPITMDQMFEDHELGIDTGGRIR